MTDQDQAPDPAVQRGYDAVYALIREWKTDVYTNAHMWRAVETFRKAAMGGNGGRHS